MSVFSPISSTSTPPQPKDLTTMTLFDLAVAVTSPELSPTQTKQHLDLEISPRLSKLLGGLATSGQIENLRITGPSGCGKTSVGQWLAQETGRPLLIMDCAVVREPRDWFGFRTVQDGKIGWQDTEFVRAVEAGNYIILLDEMNRASTSVLNGLFSLTDHRRRAWIEERQKAVVVGPNTMFIATTNVGSRYVGASPIDAALDERFGRMIEMTYLSHKEEANLLQRRTGITEDHALALSEVAQKTRQSTSTVKPISTRRLLSAAADLSRYGESSLEYTLLTACIDLQERSALAALLMGKFPGIIEGSDNAATQSAVMPF